jgi:catechol 2,3-dioxygenase-like lactoylglutathione lyase family enzyme
VATDPNVLQTVPFLTVTDIEASVRFYAEGLGFAVTNRWVDKGKLRWCWLQRGGAALMLQEDVAIEHDYWTPAGEPSGGITLYFICADAIAIYQELTARGIEASTPTVGNAMWVTEVEDPDGYQLAFESSTDAPEDTVYDGA